MFLTQVNTSETCCYYELIVKKTSLNQGEWAMVIVPQHLDQNSNFNVNFGCRGSVVVLIIVPTVSNEDMCE